MENIESLRVVHESPNSRKEQRNFIASVLLDAVNESLAENDAGKRFKDIHWDKVDKARKYLLNNPIAHLYFILLDINIDAALGRLQRKWEAMDRETNSPRPYQIDPKPQQPRILH
jgi:hypothetical protein